MCLFNFRNKTSGKARIKGIEEFECGHCPECLQKKSRKWALRCAMEAKVSPGVMVTLTYDTYKVINGKLSEYQENPIDPNMQLSKRDCQLFIKRLRKHFEPLKIKYLLTAERGKKGRAHYHALIFGVQFNDLIKYKKSDRGNWIYKSKTLTDIWKNGICTVDCINLSAKTARYCTKYCAKDSGANETFMLFSRGIGDQKLLELFNGKSYWVDGREYSIPKQIWQKVIEKRYNCKGYSKYVGKEHLEIVGKKLCNQLDKWEKMSDFHVFDEIKRKYYRAVRLANNRLSITADKNDRLYLKWLKSVEHYEQKWLEYVNTPWQLRRGYLFYKYRRVLEKSEERYNYSKFKREIFEKYRDNDPQYISYLEYWKEKNRVADFTRPSVDERILALPDNKYRTYKAQAIRAKLIQYSNRGVRKYDFYRKCFYYERPSVTRDFIPPRSNCQAFLKSEHKTIKEYKEKSFAPLSRHYRANDTARKRFEIIAHRILYEQEKREFLESSKDGLPLLYFTNRALYEAKFYRFF